MSLEIEKEIKAEFGDASVDDEATRVILPISTYRKLRTLLQGLAAYIATQLEQCRVDNP